MSNIQIIGLDPSLNNFGIAKASVNVHSLEYVITDLSLHKSEDETGKVVRKNSDDLRRAQILFDGMTEACNGAVLAIAEVPVGSQSARAMASYGICVGVLSACPIPLIEVTPQEVKIAATGNKKATKEDMIAWAMNKFPSAPWLLRKSKGKMEPISANEHLADACAAIEAGLKTQQFKQAVAMYRAMSA